MWDENKVLELLKDMPQVLTDENLCEIQEIIDDNKYWNSRKLKHDLCGTYAPFCKICDKTVLTPCAVAYVRMKNAEGMKLSMENISNEIEHPEALYGVDGKGSKSAKKNKNEKFVEPEVEENKTIRIGIGYKKY